MPVAIDFEEDKALHKVGRGAIRSPTGQEGRRKEVH